jgi:hypothetical protein
MNHKVQLDETLRAKLNGLNEPLDFCDEKGHVVGYYLPADEYRKLLYALAKVEVTDEELKAARRQPGGKTTPELLARFEELRQQFGMNNPGNTQCIGPKWPKKP